MDILETYQRHIRDTLGTYWTYKVRYWTYKARGKANGHLNSRGIELQLVAQLEEKETEQEILESQ